MRAISASRAPNLLGTFMLAAFFLVLPALAARAAVDIQEVRSDKGIVAWLVEDHSIPIVTINFSFKGGSSQDPAGKEGLANLMTGLFDEGAGDLDSEAFQTKLDDAGAEMRFREDRDNIFGSMRLLSEQRDEAFDLLRAASQDLNRKLREVAAEVEETGQLPEPRLPGTASAT